MYIIKFDQLYLFVNSDIFQLSKTVRFRGRKVTHNGLIGMLEGGEIDIALADLSLTYKRAVVNNTLL